MTAPRFYSWDDDGSPGRALTGNLQNRLKQILVPCLVTGYGSKPGAGWTLEHEHANGFTLGNGQNYINFVSSLAGMSTRSVHIYVAESLVDTSEAIIQGVNLCSADYRDGVGTNRHNVYVYWPLVGRIGALQWSVVADDKTVVLSCGTKETNATSQFTIFFGDAINDLGIGNTFIALGGENAGYNSDGSNGNNTYTLCRGFTSPRNQATGLADYNVVEASPFSSFYNTFRSNANSAAMPAKINFQQPRLTAGSDFVGKLKGVVYDDVLGLGGWGRYLTALGLNGADDSDMNKFVKIEGYRYAYCKGFMGGFVMTDNPAFW